MSGKVVGWAMEQRTGSPTAKLVLVKLADNANEEGYCWPSMKLLKDHTELSERAIRKQIKDLEKLGLITVHRKSVEGVQLRNRFTLNISRAGVLHEVHRVNEVHEGVNGEQYPLAQEAVSPLHDVQANKDNRQTEPSENRHSLARESGIAVEDAFLPIWSAFQQWPGLSVAATEARALAAYDRMRGELPPDAELIACIAAQGREFIEENARRTPRQGRLLIPHPHTWLERDRGWKKHLAAVRAEPARVAAALSKRAQALGAIPASVVAKLDAQDIPDLDWYLEGASFEFGPPPRLRIAQEFRRRHLLENYRGRLEKALGPDVVVDVPVGRKAAA